jgi:hypothetical protein
MEDIDGQEPDEIIEDENPFETKRGTYAVGYRKPPRQHRFKKGNKAAAGKRKKPASKTAQMLMKIAGENIEVNVNGKRVRMSRKEALLRQLFDRAMKSQKEGIRMAQLVLGIEDAEPFDPAGQHNITIEFVHTRPQGLPGCPEGNSE